MANEDAEDREDVVNFLEGDVIRALRGHVIREDDLFLYLLRNDGLWRIRKTTILKVHEAPRPGAEGG